MPALALGNPGVPLVAGFCSLLNELLNEAAEVKPAPTIEPTLKKSNFSDITGRISSCLSGNGASDGDGNHVQDTGYQDASKTQQFAIIETAARDLFGQLIVGVYEHCYPSLPILLTLCLAGHDHNRITRFCQNVESP